MIRLRSYFLAGLAASLLGVSPGWGQTNPELSCNAQAMNTLLLRSESAAELIGDVVIQCSGGTPTPAGSEIPAYTITVTLSTPIASRVFSHDLSEALLIVDNAFPSNPNPVFAVPQVGAGNPQNLCVAIGPSACPIVATGNPSGNPGGDYDGTGGHYNVFEGYASGFNSVTFSGVPVDAPGPSGVLDLRLTNIRANLSQLTVPPYNLALVTALIGTELVSNSPIVVGYADSGLTVMQTPPTPISGTSYSTLSVTLTEGFQTAFKTWTYLEGAGPQNVPGFPYNAESGLWDKLSPPLGIPELGVASHGTRLMLHFSGYPVGVTIIGPSAEYLVGQGGSPNTGGVAYVATDANGNSSSGPQASSSKVVEITTDSQGNGWLTYEVVKCDPVTLESVTIPLIIESQSAGTVTGSYGPLVSSGETPIPRFVRQ